MRFHSARSLTLRTACWRSTCSGPDGARRSSPQPRSFTPMITGRSTCFGGRLMSGAGLREVIGHREAYGVRISSRWIRDEVQADLDFAAGEGLGPLRRAAAAPGSFRHACLRHAGAVLGSRSARLSPSLRRRLSLERRASFEPQGWAPDARS